MMRWLSSVVVLSLVASSVAADAKCAVRKAEPELRDCWGIVNQGTLRRYILYVPESARFAPQPVPLVLDFHGMTSNANRYMGVSCWRDFAEREGIVVAYPQGTGPFNTFDAGECCGFPPPGGRDDLQFARDVVKDVVARLAQEHLTVDTARVFATGHSNGGKMAHHLACEAPDFLAGVSAVAQAYSLGPNRDCPEHQRIPLIEFRGDADPVVRYNEESVEHWASTMHCERNGAAWSVEGFEPALSEAPEPGSPAAACKEFKGCAASLAFCKVPADHQTYANTAHVDLCQTAWDFWQQSLKR
ncbi:MAG TPA: PHB depolymerase family esterase [Polyangiales bacterium]